MTPGGADMWEPRFTMLTRTGQIQLAPWVYEVVESADNPLRDVVRLRAAPEFPDSDRLPRS